MGCGNSTNSFSDSNLEIMTPSQLATVLRYFESPIKFYDPFETFHELGDAESVQNKLDPQLEMVFCEQWGPLSEMKDYIDHWNEKFRNFNHPNLLMDYTSIIVPSIKITLLIDSPVYALSHHPELIKQNPLQEEEMWFLLDCVSGALAYMQERKVRCSTLTTKDIYSVRTPFQKNIYKLSDRFWKPVEKGGFYDLVAAFDDNETFKELRRQVLMSPVQIRNLPQKNKFYIKNFKIIRYPQQNLYKTKIFVFGMICLYCLDLEPSVDSYDWINYDIKVEYLENRLEKLRKQRKFSNTFLVLMTKMLQMDEDARLDCLELNEEISSIYSKVSKRRLLETFSIERFTFDPKSVDAQTSKINKDSKVKPSENVIGIQKLDFLDDPEVNLSLTLKPTELQLQKLLNNRDNKITAEFEHSDEIQKNNSHIASQNQEKNQENAEYHKVPLEQNTSYITPQQRPLQESQIKSFILPPQQNPDSFQTPNDANILPDQLLANIQAEPEFNVTNIPGVVQGNQIHYINQYIYAGGIQDGKRNGKGVLCNAEGKKEAEGVWVNDLPNGQFTFHYYPQVMNLEVTHNKIDQKAWKRYDGTVVGGVKQGKGRVVLVNGDCFDGEFKENKICGKGVYYYSSGKQVKGEWKDDIFKG